MKQPSGYFTVYRDFYRSDVYALSPNAKAVLVDILYRYTGKNNGEIQYSENDAARAVNKSKRTGARALVELQEAGLIKATTKGSFADKTGTREGATQWQLTFVS